MPDTVLIVLPEAPSTLYLFSHLSTYLSNLLCISIYKRTHTHICIYVYRQYVYMYVCIHVVCMHIQTYVYIYMCVCVYIPSKQSQVPPKPSPRLQLASMRLPDPRSSRDPSPTVDDINPALPIIRNMP